MEFSNPLDEVKTKPPVDKKYVVQANSDVEKVPIDDVPESTAWVPEDVWRLKEVSEQDTNTLISIKQSAFIAR